MTGPAFLIILTTGIVNMTAPLITCMIYSGLVHDVFLGGISKFDCSTNPLILTDFERITRYGILLPMHATYGRTCAPFLMPRSHVPCCPWW